MNPWAPLVAAVLGWGSAAVLTRAILVDGVSTFTMLPFRLGTALVTLAAISTFTRRFTRLGGEHWRRGLVLGTVAMGIPMCVLTLSLEDLPVSLGGLLIALIPLTTVVAAHFLVEGERFDKRGLPGLALSFVGTGVLVGIGGDTVAGVGNLGRGVGYAVIGVVLAGIGGALTRKYALEVGGNGLVIPQFAVATVLLFVAMPFLASTPLAAIDAFDWTLIALLGSAATALPFASFLIGAEVNSAARLGLIGYLVPVLAVALAVVFLHERLTLAIVAGAAMIIAGVVLTERASNHVPEPGAATTT